MVMETRLELRQQSRAEHLAVHFVVGDHEEIHPERWDFLGGFSIINSNYPPVN